MLSPKQGETYLDLTAGYGGHADKILEVTRNYKDAVLNDRDQNAIDFLEAKYQEEKPKLMHTTAEPAKSWKPSSDNHPPPHDQ